MGCHTHSSRHRVGRPSAPWQRRGWAGKLRPPDEEGALLSTETPHLPEPRQEGASPSPGTEATATAIPRGPHPQQVAACRSSLPPPGLPQGPEPEPHGRGGSLGSWGLRVSASLSNELSPVCPQGLGCVCLPAGFYLWRPLGEGDKDNRKWPPWPTVCCQKPTVPSQLASGKPVALCGGQGGIRTEPGSCPARWGSRLWGWRLWHGPPTPPRSTTLGSY